MLCSHVLGSVAHTRWYSSYVCGLLAPSYSQIQYDAGVRIESDSWGFINPYTYTDSSSQVRQAEGQN